MYGALIRGQIGVMLALMVGCSPPASAPTSGNSPAQAKGTLSDPTSNDEQHVRRVVQRFYDTFNSHDWEHAAEFTTEDYTHIDPGGGWTQGREAVLESLKVVHSTFLKDVTDTPEEMEVRFAAANVAVVTVPSKMVGAFTTPTGSSKRTTARSGRSSSSIRMADGGSCKTRTPSKAADSDQIAIQ